MPSENDIKTQPKKLYIINRVETEREIPKLKLESEWKEVCGSHQRTLARISIW